MIENFERIHKRPARDVAFIVGCHDPFSFVVFAVVQGAVLQAAGGILDLAVRPSDETDDIKTMDANSDLI